MDSTNIWKNQNIRECFQDPLWGPYWPLRSLRYPQGLAGLRVRHPINTQQVDRGGVIEKVCWSHLTSDPLSCLSPVCDHVSPHWTSGFWILTEVILMVIWGTQLFTLLNYLTIPPSRMGPPFDCSAQAHPRVLFQPQVLCRPDEAGVRI